MSATKYKPGDKVRVKNIHVSEELGGYWVTLDMEKCANKVVTIEKIDDDTYKIRECIGHWWTDEMFEDIDSPESTLLEPTFKVGDKVRVKERKGASSDYPFGFVDPMTSYKGVYTIKEVIYNPNILSTKKKYIGDCYQYFLEEDESRYIWASSMLEPATALKESKIRGSEVIFKIGSETLRYILEANYLRNASSLRDNDEIFKKLNISDKVAFCKDCYGYNPPGYGMFPYFREGDWAAAQRVIDALYKECEKFNKSQCCTEPISSVSGDNHGVKVIKIGLYDPSSDRVNITTLKDKKSLKTEKEITLSIKHKTYKF